MRIYIIILAIATFNAACIGQQDSAQLSYKTPPQSLFVHQNTNAYAAEIEQRSKGAYNVASSLPANYVTDGSIDYTSCLQNVINKYNNIIMPDFPILINATGLTIKSNSTIIFKKNSKLILQANDKASYNMLLLQKVNNITLYNIQLTGDRQKHSGNAGEWGMGISIKGAQNITIINPVINSCWGDGMYIGDYNGNPSKNIRIYNLKANNNRRNGISIISADSVKVMNAVLTNTFGTEPEAGLDVEPNNNSNTISNIQLDNIVTFNSGYGIVLGLSKLPGALRKKVNIVIRNHYDERSKTAFYLGGYYGSYAGDPLDGNIEIINPVWKYNALALKNNSHYKNGPFINFKHISIFTKNNRGESFFQNDTLLKIKNKLAGESKISFQ